MWGCGAYRSVPGCLALLFHKISKNIIRIENESLFFRHSWILWTFHNTKSHFKMFRNVSVDVYREPESCSSASAVVQFRQLHDWKSLVTHYESSKPIVIIYEAFQKYIIQLSKSFND